MDLAELSEGLVPRSAASTSVTPNVDRGGHRDDARHAGFSFGFTATANGESRSYVLRKGEEVHGVLKTDLAGRRLPSGRFGANATWWAHAVMACNLHAALRRLVLGPAWAGKRMKAVRFALLALPGRVVRHATADHPDARGPSLLHAATLGAPSHPRRRPQPALTPVRPRARP